LWFSLAVFVLRCALLQAHFDTCGDVEAVAKISSALCFRIRDLRRWSLLPNVGRYDAVGLLKGWKSVFSPLRNIRARSTS
jgi:hypothetical protein